MTKRFRTLFDGAMNVLAGILIVTLLVVVTLGIVTRAFGEPLIWTDEASRFLMLWLAVTGWVIASRRRVHIRIRFFHDLLPPRGWRSAETVMQAAMVVFGALVAWHSLHLVSVNWDLEATSLPLSIGWLYVPMVFAGLVTIVQGVLELIETIANWSVSPYEPGEPPITGEVL